MISQLKERHLVTFRTTPQELLVHTNIGGDTRTLTMDVDVLILVTSLLKTMTWSTSVSTLLTSFVFPCSFLWNFEFVILFYWTTQPLLGQENSLMRGSNFLSFICIMTIKKRFFIYH